MMKKLLLLIIALLPMALMAQSTIEKMPNRLKNYAAKIKDSGKSLEQEDFSMEPAIVKGKIYNFIPKLFVGKLPIVVNVYINNPFFGQEIVAAELKPDNTFELKVPMTVKHQTVWLYVSQLFNGLFVCSAGKTVEVSFDANDPLQMSGPLGGLPPYFAGENVDLNYALNLPFYQNFLNELLLNKDTEKKVAAFTMLEYKQFILDGYERYNNMVDTMHITKRAKEFMHLMLKYQSAEILSRAFRNLQIWRKQYNVKCAKPQYQDDINGYYNYPKTLDIDNIMMFYTYDMSQIINLWGHFGSKMQELTVVYSDAFRFIYFYNATSELPLSEKEKVIRDAIADKMREEDTTRTDEEIAFLGKYSKNIEDYFEKERQKKINQLKAACGGEGLFYDFGKLYDICVHYIPRGIPVPDSLVTEIEKLSRPFYTQYVKTKNAEIRAKIKSEKSKGGYYEHKADESEADSLLVELLKDCHGKVVLIDFWNTWCGPCRAAIKEMEPMKVDFEGKDVVFLYLADTSSPENEYNNLILTINGLHFRLPENQVNTLKRKWGFSGIPAYVLIGKDGMVKYQGGSGAEYFKNKIEEELNK